ncbi:MAG TPA: rhodanese-like domain-containing protein [Usitatibacter sp.]|nr:rhodanese-like domain-containing protein [Usitatibacter sp.]
MADFIAHNLLLIALFFVSGAMLFWPEISKLIGMGGNEIGTLEATRLLNQSGTLVIDVRDEKEYAAGHLPRARHVPLNELDKKAAELAKFKDKPVVLTCRSGPRAAAAARALRRAGFANVYQLKGGIAAWQQASLPLEK